MSFLKSFSKLQCFLFLQLIFAVLIEFTASKQVQLIPDGNSKNTYALIDSVLGGTAYEPPDCAHKSFGPHITQQQDKDLKKPVFAFHIHVTPDNDGCSKFDRQRNEIKTYGPSPNYLKGFLDDSVSFTWTFKLDRNFKPSKSFTHIHQIKAGDGDAGHPMLTITPRKGSNSSNGKDIMQVIHINSKGTTAVLKSADLQPFLGQWIQATETITYSSNGKFSLSLKKLSDNTELLRVSSNKIDLWRDETTFVRPKWGIYRSLNDKASLRDETVLFGGFCIAKGKDSCDK